jgi:hypothetical protein
VQRRRLLYRSFGATLCRLKGVKLLALFFFLVATDGVWIVSSWRVDRARLPLPPGVYLWRAPIQDRRSSDCVPDRWDFSNDSISYGSINTFVCRGFFWSGGSM